MQVPLYLFNPTYRVSKYSKSNRVDQVKLQWKRASDTSSAYQPLRDLSAVENDLVGGSMA